MTKLIGGHPVAETQVDKPTLVVRPEFYQYAKRDSAPDEDLAYVQWYSDLPNEEHASIQFRWPICLGADSLHFMGHPELFRTCFLGKAKDWLNPSAAQAMITGPAHGNPDALLIYLVTSFYGVDDGKGGVTIPSFVVQVIALASGELGIIGPRLYMNPEASKQEYEALQAMCRTPPNPRRELLEAQRLRLPDGGA